MRSEPSLDEIMGESYTLKNGEWVVLYRMSTTRFPYTLADSKKITVHVSESGVSSQGDMMYIFTLSPHCKRYLRVSALPDTIKEKLAWALAQNVWTDVEDFDSVSHDELGVRVSKFQYMLLLTEKEYKWLYSPLVREADMEYIADGKLSPSLTMKGNHDT